MKVFTKLAAEYNFLAAKKHAVYPALSVLGSEAKRYLTDDALSVLPLFLLMGTFASVAGIGSDIYRLFDAFLGHLKGGLAHATIGACASFGALTGSSLATQMTIGRIAMYTKLRHFQVDDSFSVK